MNQTNGKSFLDDYLHKRSWIAEKNVLKELHKRLVQREKEKEKRKCYPDEQEEITNYFGIAADEDMTLSPVLLAKIKGYDIVTFSEMLFFIIKDENLDEVELYKKADIDRRLFSKIRSDRHYLPSKKTVIKLIFALEADSTLSDNLMSLAGYRLSDNLLSDVIVKFFIDNNIFNKALLDEALVRYKQKAILAKNDSILLVLT